MPERIDWQARYERLVEAAYETRERCANFSECRLTEFQRNTLLNVMEPVSDALARPDASATPGEGARS